MGLRINEAKWLDKYGRWQIKVRKNGARRTFCSYTPGRAGKRECHKKADAWLDEGLHVPRVRVSVVYEQYLKEVALRTGERSARVLLCRSIGANHILPAIGCRQIGSLCEQDLQDVINAAYRRGLSRQTLYNIRASINSFLVYCTGLRITRLTAQNLIIPKGAPSGEKKVLSPAHVHVLFTDPATTYNGQVVDDWYIHAYRLYVAVGLRRGELVALTRKDQPPGHLAVLGSVNNQRILTTGKTDRAKRVFPLPELARRILADQEQMLRDAGIVSPYLFPDRDGRISNPAVIYNSWKRYLKYHGIPHVSIHELRHTFISVCKSYLPLSLIRAVAGHSPTTPTLDIYGHVMDGELERAAQMINKAQKDLFDF